MASNRVPALLASLSWVSFLQAASLVPLTTQWFQEATLHSLSPYLADGVHDLHAQVSEQWHDTIRPRHWSLVDTSRGTLLLLDRLLQTYRGSVHAVALAVSVPPVVSRLDGTGPGRYVLAPALGPESWWPSEFVASTREHSRDVLETALVLANDGMDMRDALRSAQLLNS